MEGMKEEENAEERTREKRERVVFEKISEGTCVCVKMLLQLKSLALEADSELQRQDEALDVLMSSSERSTATIDTHTRRMRKLL